MRLRLIVTTRATALALVATVVVALSCGHTLPAPPRTTHPMAAYVEVPFPPPPGRVEFVPPKPKQGAVWLDGEWTWEPVSARWAWKYGRWVVPPDGARYARWSLVRAADGTLFFASGAWRDVRGAEVTAPPVLALAKASGEDVVSPEGTTEPTRSSLVPEPRQGRPAPLPESAPDAGCLPDEAK